MPDDTNRNKMDSRTSDKLVASGSASLVPDQSASAAAEMAIEPGAAQRDEDQDLVDQMSAAEGSFDSSAGVYAEDAKGMDIEPSLLSSPELASETLPAPRPSATITTNTRTNPVAATFRKSHTAPTVVVSVGNYSKATEKKMDEVDNATLEVNDVLTIEQLSSNAEDEFRKELAKYNRPRDLPQSRFRGVSWDRRMNYWRVKLNAVHSEF